MTKTRSPLRRIVHLLAAASALLLTTAASAQLSWVLDASSPIAGNTPQHGPGPGGSTFLGKWDWTPDDPDFSDASGSFLKTAGQADFDVFLLPDSDANPVSEVEVDSTSGPYTVLFAAVKAGNSYNLFSLTDSSNPLGTSFLFGPANKDISHVSFYGTAAIPEPGTYALIFGAAALVFAVWRRRRSASVTA